MGKLKIIKEEKSKPNLPLLYFDDLEDGDVFQYIEKDTSGDNLWIKDAANNKAFNLSISFNATPSKKPVKKVDATLTWREAE